MDPTHVPTLILHAPDEEGVEACLSYAGPERLCGLSNSGRSRSVGLVNALVQILGATEEVTQQLPVVANNKHTRDFADTVRQMHRISRNSMPCDSLLLDGASDWLVQKLAQAQNPTTTTTAGFNETETVDHIAQVYALAPKLLLDQLKDCRFGNAFKGAFEREKDAIVDSGLEESFSATTTTASDCSVSLNNTRMTLDIDLQIYPEQDSIDLLTLLRNHFGIKPQPAFFFGFSSSPNPTRHAPSVRTITSPDLDALLPQPNKTNTTTIASPINLDPPKRYTSLPHFFFIILNRPVSTANRSTMHRTSVEMPLDLDFGFLLTPEAYKANAAANKHARQNTLYKLHGFVTQTEGRFLAYTRLRGGGGCADGSIAGDWYKAEDEVVSTSPVDLGNRVNSKGVVFMLYCVQNGKK
ncbi:hypothetical protein BJ741DRAFT_620597 [Chytriomyces cf. hyalinus JEL632]|nr:hypothetical protein BJ741DRAFT_620597 [Chytriomyces cf. hyalinus JEL632]